MSENGPHGESFAAAAARFHLSFIIGNDQPQHAGLPAVRAAGQLMGYRFVIDSAERQGDVVRVDISNRGIAPCYVDVWPSQGAVRSPTSLRGLLPGQKRRCLILSAAIGGPLSLSSDRIVPGQRIGLYRPTIDYGTCSVTVIFCQLRLC